VSSLADHGLFPDSPLDTVRLDLCRQIDEQAEVIRLRYLTPGAGQAFVYVLKGQEASAAVADPAPTQDRYPLLSASLGIDGDTLAEVATTVLSAAATSTGILVYVEFARLAAKRAITAAATTAEALAAFDAAPWLDKLP
jgi:hypothetical protein